VSARLPMLAAAAVLALAAAGCGDSEDGPAAATTVSGDPTALTKAERDQVREDEAAIVRYCRARALALSEPDERPSVAEQSRALEAVDALVALAAAKPEAEVRPGVALSLFLGDLTENLEGANCDPQILARLDAGLATVP
jgi:hypothetical protein